jgi:hybrid polyketide synthase/nonribosomal peptide synthetase ACE1
LTEFDQTAASQPTTLALQDSIGNSLTWFETASKSISVGHALTKLQLPPNSRIGVFQQPNVDWIYSMLGIWRAEHTYVPLETTQGIRRLVDVAREAALAAIIVHDATVTLAAQLNLSDATPVVNVSRLPAGRPSAVPAASTIRGEDEAMIIYTSGSTGVPKVGGPALFPNLGRLTL